MSRIDAENFQRAGLRYEFQPNVPRPLYGNLAPRFSLAYAPGSRRTVIRAGAGVFTDRQPPLLEQQALLYDGLRIRQTVIQDPAFPNPFGGPTPASFATPSVVRIAPDIRNPYLMQEGVSVERQLGAGRNSLTVEFTSLRGIGLYRMRNINAPLLGTGAPPDPNYINIKDLRYATPLASTKLCDVIVPGDPAGSVVYQKVTSRPGMPPLGTAAVDPLTFSVLVNSEDGYLYRWSLVSNTLTQRIQLTSGIGESYTPTAVGSDGTVYAINDATLFAVGEATT